MAAEGAGIRVLGICGSLRQGSHNRMALRAAQKLAPAGMTVEEFEGLREIPPYDEDVKAKGFPPAVEALREGIRRADALLLVTPEYNYSVPGVMKNAIDWASRPPDQPFADKPVAIMSASPGLFGGARAQYQLRQCFIYLDAKLLNRPEVMIGQSGQKFSEDGTLKDEDTAKHIARLMGALGAWTRRLRGTR